VSVPPYTFEVGQTAWTGADTKGSITGRRFHDGTNHYQIDGRWYSQDELVAAETPAAKPLLDAAEVDLIVDALGHLAGSLADRGNDGWTDAAALQERLSTPEAKLRLTLLASAFTMTDLPTGGTE
jgi:hypothetical protein